MKPILPLRGSIGVRKGRRAIGCHPILLHQILPCWTILGGAKRDRGAYTQGVVVVDEVATCRNDEVVILIIGK